MCRADTSRIKCRTIPAINDNNIIVINETATDGDAETATGVNITGGKDQQHRC